jgi:hypothetical protein
MRISSSETSAIKFSLLDAYKMFPFSLRSLQVMEPLLFLHKFSSIKPQFRAA